MKKIILGLTAVLAVVFIAMQVVIATKGTSSELPKENIKRVEAIEQESAEEHSDFVEKPYEAPVIDGTNVALNADAKVSGFNDVYSATNLNDGDRLTYWEGKANVEENSVIIEFDNSYNIHTILLGLNPAAIWQPRVQTISFALSDDGENFTEFIPLTEYQFDPKTGNEIVIRDLAGKGKFIKITITANTGAVAGQIAEFEVYTSDK